MEVRQLEVVLGAEIRGMDLSQLMALENHPGKPGNRAR